jgi:hypothetical protein
LLQYRDLTLDGSNNLYIVGRATSPIFPGARREYVARYSPIGSAYSQVWEVTQDDLKFGIRAQASLNATAFDQGVLYACGFETVLAGRVTFKGVNSLDGATLFERRGEPLDRASSTGSYDPLGGRRTVLSPSGPFVAAWVGRNKMDMWVGQYPGYALPREHSSAPLADWRIVPVAGAIEVEVGPSPPGVMAVFDGTGRRIEERMFGSVSRSQVFRFEGLSAGVYWVRARTTCDSRTGRTIVFP